MLDTITSVLKLQILYMTRNEHVDTAKVVHGIDKQIKHEWRAKKKGVEVKV